MALFCSKDGTDSSSRGGRRRSGLAVRLQTTMQAPEGSQTTPFVCLCGLSNQKDGDANAWVKHVKQEVLPIHVVDVAVVVV